MPLSDCHFRAVLHYLVYSTGKANKNEKFSQLTDKIH